MRSHLEKLLMEGHFVVTAECGPPRGADKEAIEHKAKLLKGYVDAVNVTDCQSSVVRLSSLCACLILQENGVEAIMQMTTRDRNRIALQSDILGAAALGIRNILCITGDHQSKGDHPFAKNVFDIDSVQFLWTVRKMRDDGELLSGEKLTKNPSLFIGAVENPFADPLDIRILRIEKKVDAGAQFIQTQCIFDIERFEEFMELFCKRGLHERVALLGGVTPLRSLGMARYMKENVAGIRIPDSIIERLKSVPKEEVKEEGIRICVETIKRLKNMEGVRGVHIMAIEWEEIVPEIVRRTELFPRPD